MGKYLIYTLAIGPKCHAFASMLIESIFSIGDWNQDVIVLTDCNSVDGLRKEAKVINICSGSLAAILPRDGRRDYYSKYKPVIRHCIDVTAYDYILYLDADVLVNSNRIRDLIYDAHKSGKIQVMKDCITVKDNNKVSGRYVLTEQEKTRWADAAINAGVFGIPGGNFGHDFLSCWNIKGQPKKKESDQAALYALLFRQYDNQWTYLNDVEFGRKLQKYEQTIIHFTRYKDPLMRPYFEVILGLRSTSVGS